MTTKPIQDFLGKWLAASPLNIRNIS